MTDTSKDAQKLTNTPSLDKQSLTALKMHGEKIVYAVLLVLVVFFGWQYYQNHYAKIDTVAADAYTSIAMRDEQILQTLQNTQAADEVKEKLANEQKTLLADIDHLVAEHGDTIYAWQALMIKARYQTQNNDLQGAVATLDQAAAMTKLDDGLASIAKIRHAHALLANSNPEAALVIANQAMPEAFEASRQELLGDIYTATNKLDDAKAAYTKAWQVLNDRQENRSILSLKLQSLGVTVEPIQVPQVVAVPSTQALTDANLQPLVEGELTPTDTDGVSTTH